MSAYLVLFQKQIDRGPAIEPAKVALVFPMNKEALESALKKVMWNYTPWAIPFKELPPERVLIRACEEAVRAGRGQKLPLAVRPRDKSEFELRVANGLVSP